MRNFSMYFLICVTVTLFAGTFAAKGDSCVTPNGENAKCVSINSCYVIQQAIAYLDQAAVEFARQSQCGHDGSPLVCCGTAGRVTTPAPVTVPTTTKRYVPVYGGTGATPIKNIFLPDNSLCGLQSKQERKSTGRVTELDEFPWVVALKYIKADGKDGGFRCSGTLMNQRYVLTPARCLNIPGFNLTGVRLGEWNFSKHPDCTLGKDNMTVCVELKDLAIIEAIPHPYFNNRSKNNDIALLRVDGKIRYNDYIRPICLPPIDFPPPIPTSTMEVSGWDIADDGTYTGAKIKSLISMVGHDECETAFKNYTQLKPNRACIKSNIDKELYVGDSGRPIMRTYDKEDKTDEKQWFLEGIVYEGLGCGDCEEPQLYTRVSRYINWILSNIKKS